MYQLSGQINPLKVFLIKRSELEERLEPKYYTKKYKDNENRLLASKYPVKSLVEVSNLISDGTHFTPVYVKEGVKFISVKDVRRFQISYLDSKFISKQEAEQLDKRCKPQRDDILLTKIGTFGYAARVDTDEEFQIFVSLALVRPNEAVYPKYLEIFLNSELAFVQYERVIKGSGVPDLHLEDIRRIKMPLPPIDIQSEIIQSFQDKFDLKVQKETQARSILKEIYPFLLNALGVELEHRESGLKTRIFHRKLSELNNRLDPLYYHSDLTVFNSGSYPSQKIGKVAFSFKSGSGAGKQDQARKESGIIQIRPTNIKEYGILNFDKNIYIPADELTDSSLLEVNDVLFNNTNSQEWVGKTAVNTCSEKMSYSNHVTRIRVNEDKITPDYLCLILNAYQRYKIFYSICTNWNNQSGIGLDLLVSLDIPVPPLEKQNEITNHILGQYALANSLFEEANLLMEIEKKYIEMSILGE